MGIFKSAVKQVAVAAIVVVGKIVVIKVASKVAEKVAKSRVTANGK